MCVCVRKQSDAMQGDWCRVDSDRPALARHDGGSQTALWTLFERECHIGRVERMVWRIERLFWNRANGLCLALMVGPKLWPFAI